MDRQNVRRAADLRATNRDLQKRVELLAALLGVQPRPVPMRCFEVAAGGLAGGLGGSDYHDRVGRPDGLWLAVGDASGDRFAAGLIMLMVRSGLGALLRGRAPLAPG